MIPKRIRLLQACRAHLYDEVRVTLATDKELRALHNLNSRIEKGYMNLTKEKKSKIETRGLIHG